MGYRECSKLRLLVVYDILRRGEWVNSAAILRELAMKWDIEADRKTIYADMDAIDRIVPVERRGGKTGGFRIQQKEGETMAEKPIKIDEREKHGCWVHGKGRTYKSKNSVRFSTDGITPESLNGPVIIVQKGKDKK